MAGGGSTKPEESGKKSARIEIIPLIDVIFFLLATFVLFTLSLNRIGSTELQLPVAGGSSNDAIEDKTVYIQASDGDNVYWNKELITFGEVYPKLLNYKNNEANPRVLITGDPLAKYGLTVRILDEVRKADIKQVSIETKVRSTGK